MAADVNGLEEVVLVAGSEVDVGRRAPSAVTAPLRVAIMGAGALGATFGFLFAEAGADVTLIDVDAAKIEAIEREGLTVIMPDGSRRTRRMAARTDPREVGPVDLVQISVKGYHTRSAAELCVPMLGPRTYVLSLQNGLLNLERIAEVVGRQRVLGGVVAHSAMPLGPTVIKYNGGLGGVDYGRLDGMADPGLERVSALFGAAGLPVHRIDGDVRPPIWRKLLANTATNTVAAVTGMTGAQIRDSPAASEMIRALARETARVARAQGLDFEELDAPGDFVIRTLDFVGDNKVSMLQDIEAGRRTEVENLSLAVVGEGELAGVATPLNWCMGMLILALQQRPLLGREALVADGAAVASNTETGSLAEGRADERRGGIDRRDYYKVV